MSSDKHISMINQRFIDLLILCAILHQDGNATLFTSRKGVAVDRLVGFQDLGGKDDFSTKTLEVLLIKKGNSFVLGLGGCIS